MVLRDGAIQKFVHWVDKSLLQDSRNPWGWGSDTLTDPNWDSTRGPVVETLSEAGRVRRSGERDHVVTFLLLVRVLFNSILGPTEESHVLYEPHSTLLISYENL